MAVRLVVQRCAAARVGRGGADGREAAVGRGLVVLLGLADGADALAVRRAADAVVRLPLSTAGAWGDGSKAQPLLRVLLDGTAQGVLVVPQACLAGEPRGRSAMRYSGQLDKRAGLALLCEFLAALEEAVLRGVLERMFRDASALAALAPFAPGLGEWVPCPDAPCDKRGVPTHDADGAPLGKADRKRVDAAYKHLDALIVASGPHRVRRWLAEQAVDSALAAEMLAEAPALGAPATPELGRFAAFSPAPVAAGAYGALQALHLDASIGPSTHVLAF